MTAEIVTPEKVLFEGEIYLVRVPGTKGSFEVLKNHVPIVSSLEQGQIKVITQKGEELFFDIKSGFIEVADNNIHLIVRQ